MVKAAALMDNIDLDADGRPIEPHRLRCSLLMDVLRGGLGDDRPPPQPRARAA